MGFFESRRFGTFVKFVKTPGNAKSRLAEIEATSFVNICYTVEERTEYRSNLYDRRDCAIKKEEDLR